MPNARFIIQVSKGLIRHQQARRLMMFYGVLIALVLLFAGSTLLATFLRAHPWLFLIYWAACAWITLLAVLLAFYDMVRVRADTRRALRKMAEETDREERDSGNADPR